MNPFQSLPQTEDIALYTADGKNVSYRQLISLAEQKAEGYRSNDFVAIEFDNSVCSIVSYVAALRHQIPVLLSNPKLDLSLRSKLYSDYQISVVHSATEGSVRIRESGPMVHPDLQLLLSTSGSTGTTKFVRLSRMNIYSNANQIGESLRITQDSCAISTLPFHYAFGLSILHSHLLHSGAIAVTPASLMEKSFWDLFHQAKVTSLAGVPTTFEQLQRLRLSRTKFPSLRQLAQAGGKLAPHLATHFAELAEVNGWQMHFMYGQTEATARIACLPPNKAQSKPNSIGQPVASGKFTIVDEQGAPISEPFTPGRLRYAGPNVMLGYAYDYRDLARGDVTGGVIDTGDVAQMDQEGDYYIVGRSSRFVKLYGARICLDTIENALSTSNTPIRIVGDDSVIVIVSEDDTVLDERKEQLVALFKIPARSIKTLVMPIPLLDSGKVNYAGIWNHYLAQVPS